jgi:hypothetical protein
MNVRRNQSSHGWTQMNTNKNKAAIRVHLGASVAQNDFLQLL